MDNCLRGNIITYISLCIWLCQNFDLHTVLDKNGTLR